MRVLGVDPGLTRCGVGVVEGARGGRLRMVAVGVIRTPRTDDPAERLGALASSMEEWFNRHEPDAVAVERVFAKANIKGIMGTAQASAVPMLAASRRGLPVALHTPTEVKAAVSGHGGADKAQVTGMVTRILGLAEAPRPADAADALALAICHIWRGGALAQLDGAVTGQNRLQQAVAAHRVEQARARRRWEDAAAAARAAHPQRTDVAPQPRGRGARPA